MALHANVLDDLGARIVSGELAEGQVLTLDAIDTRYDVSRSVSREAVRVLESMGMLASRRRVGLTVLARGHWNVFDPQLIRWRLDSAERDDQLRSLSELRSGFEPVAAALAATRATDDQRAALASAAIAMDTHGRHGDLDAFLAADVLFHRTLLEATGNEMLASLVAVVTEVLSGRTHHHLMPARPKTEAVALHEAVARAVRDGDPAAAEAAMRAIIDEATAALTGEEDERANPLS